MSYEKLRNKLLSRSNVKNGYDTQRELSRLGRLLQRTRQAVNMRQQDLALAAGIAQADISRLESGLGERGPTFDTLLRVARAQGMKVIVELVPDEDRAQLADIPKLRESF